MRRPLAGRLLLALSVPTVAFALNQTALSVGRKLGLYAVYVLAFLLVVRYFRKTSPEQ